MMTSKRDRLGRPIVVVTGMGVVTSLGAGKADNWSKLISGQSGIRNITRFPTDGLKTTMAGAIDFIPVNPFSSTDLSERLADIATEEAISQAGIGSKGNFPGPLYLAVAPVATITVSASTIFFSSTVTFNGYAEKSTAVTNP